MRTFLISAGLSLGLALSSFGQHQPVPDYVVKQAFPDSVLAISVAKPDGSRVKFSDVLALYHGKKLVVDIWASWCRDCIVGLPKLEELKKTTGEGVVYLFLSVDDSEVKWRSAISRFGIKGDHYRIEDGWKNPLANYIVLDWVPRYMVLNEEGRVVMPKAIVADDQLLKDALVD
ncbi:MAG TPA: thioredoxin-like domain-containing protein [Ohtaekwangia sp.]|nr:thioredoxin-like domain-containing protein [Ohtaekwangia sp.]